MNLSDACERNKEPILKILRGAFATTRRVLEIGSGTGQHAVYFARHLPQLLWQPSDTGEYLPPLRARITQERSVNLAAPVELDVRRQPWPLSAVDGVFSANTLHIMAWQAVEDFFSGVGAVLSADGVLCVYGPFRYAKRYTSESNEAFDRHLRERDAASGIRDFEAVEALATGAGLAFHADHDMPANNRLLVWRRACDITLFRGRNESHFGPNRNEDGRTLAALECARTCDAGGVRRAFDGSRNAAHVATNPHSLHRRGSAAT